MTRLNYEVPDELHRRFDVAASIEGMTNQEFLAHLLEQNLPEVDDE